MDLDDIMLENEIRIDTKLLENELLSIDASLPGLLHIIPIRYRPIFPGIVTPLIISRGRFTQAIDKVMADSKTIGLVLIKDDTKDEISSTDLYRFGTAARILKRINLPDGGLNVLINSIKRFRIRRIASEKPYLTAEVSYLSDVLKNPRSIEIKALTREILSQLKMLSDNNPLFTEEMKLTMLNVEEPGKIADFVTSILNIEKKEYQEILITTDVKRRLEKVLHLLHKEMEVMAVQKKIHNNVNNKIERQQKDYYLREQLKAIRLELGMDEDDRTREVQKLRKKIEDLNLKGEAGTKAMEEVERIASMDPISSEYVVTKNYLDTFVSLPWNTETKDSYDLARSERILNKDHWGLEDTKKRIVEFLAVRKIKKDSKGSIICLVGPPGVGKTSLGKSIANALNRKFFRVSLGGMRDEAEIKGHRRTYIGSLPGKIIQGLKVCGSRNPVFMLDEIDKMGQSFQGDPASALLEVLDPEQNSEFRDNYLDAPFDLSRVMFITTANTTDNIPPVLTDRMEVIRLSGYIPGEKYEIARKYLLPKQLKLHGLKRSNLKIGKKEFIYIINGWARDAGVRSVERCIERICRKAAVQYAKTKKLPQKPLSLKEIRGHLGPELYTDDELIRIPRPGLAIGLAWTSLGGSTLVIESIGIKNRKAGLKITGQLGEVMSESARIAYSYIQHILSQNESAASFFNNNTVHIHVPAGATPKDGPSAGITMATSLYSMVTNRAIKPRLSMTGELTLTGRVFPVGGVKEKIVAAKRANLKEIILPRENSKDLDEIPLNIKKGLKFHLVDSIEDVFSIAFKKKGKIISTQGGCAWRSKT